VALSLTAFFLMKASLCFYSPVATAGAAPSFATLCVDPGGAGCFSTIQAAVDAASPGDIIDVAAGTYNEQVAIDKMLTLRGAMAGIDARTRIGAESVITHADGPVQILADNVVIDGFTIQGASNDPAANPSALGAGIWTNPGFSITDGGHQILNNIVQDNIIGLFLHNTATFQARVQRNLIRNNDLDGAGGGVGVYSELGLQNALITENTFTNNPTTSILTAGSLGSQSNITISNNAVTDGRIAVLFNTTSSLITGNIAANDPLSSGLSVAGGCDGVAIRGNAFIGHGNFGVYILDFLGGSPNSNITVSHNRIVGNVAGGLQVDAGGHTGTVDAQNNWWGCNAGPGQPGCDTAAGMLDSDPWLILGISASPGSIAPGSSSTITASLRTNSDGAVTFPAGFIPNGTPAMFGATLGTMNPVNQISVSGVATSLFQAGGAPGAASISATVDNQTVFTTVNIDVTIGFNLCVQDAGTVVKINSFSGAYQILDCKKGGVINGNGTLTKLGCKIMLTDKFSSKSGGRDLTALVNTCTFVGEASFKATPAGPTTIVKDPDIRNNTCVCP
jgi:hypothetical protein